MIKRVLAACATFLVAGTLFAVLTLAPDADAHPTTAQPAPAVAKAEAKPRPQVTPPKTETQAQVKADTAEAPKAKKARRYGVRRVLPVEDVGGY